MIDVWLTLGIFLAEIVLAVRLLQVAYGSYREDVSNRKSLGFTGTVLPTANQVVIGVVGLLILGGASIIVYDILTVSTDTQNIGTSGVIPLEIGNVDIEVYEDIFGSKVLTQVDWGVVEITTDPTILRTMYIRNIGGDSFTADITTQNWLFDGNEPSGDQLSWFSITWDFGNPSLAPGRQRTAVVSLWISEQVVGITDFSFDIVITATEA